MIKKLCILMFVLQVCCISSITYLTSAEGSEPVITNVYHSPQYPIYDETVTIFSTVTDPDGVEFAQLIYCDEAYCYAPIIMSGPDAGNVYWASIPIQPGWGNGSVIGYEVHARDDIGSDNTTEKTYFFYVSEIQVNTESKDVAYLGDVIHLNGTAFYNGNESAPVANSEVTVGIIGTGIEYNSISDSTGKFSIELEFENPGDYLINTTVQNGTLVGYDEIDITVNPLFIFELTEYLQATTCYPNQQIWVNGTARYNSEKPVVNSDIIIKINETLFWTDKTDSKGDYSVLITAPKETGKYPVNVTVTNGSNSHYNETFISVTEFPLPDLVIIGEDISFISKSNPPVRYDEVNITAIVHNFGLTRATNITVSFYDGNPAIENLIGSDTVPSISIGKNAKVNMIWNATNGTHTIWIVIDPLDDITESFENNNNASKQIFVDSDFDGDGIGDIADKNDDNDAYLDEDDAFPYDPNEWLDSDNDSIGNNADDDDDNDGLSDEDELKKGTNPLNPDTDGDGVNDKKDYDPKDPDVTEESNLMWILIVIIVVVIILIVVLVVLKPFGKKVK